MGRRGTVPKGKDVGRKGEVVVIKEMKACS